MRRLLLLLLTAFAAVSLTACSPSRPQYADEKVYKLEDKIAAPPLQYQVMGSVNPAKSPNKEVLSFIVGVENSSSQTFTVEGFDTRLFNSNGESLKPVSDEGGGARLGLKLRTGITFLAGVPSANKLEPAGKFELPPGSSVFQSFSYETVYRERDLVLECALRPAKYVRWGIRTDAGVSEPKQGTPAPTVPGPPGSRFPLNP